MVAEVDNSADTSTVEPDTTYDTIYQLDYNAELYSLHARFYRRVRNVFLFISLAAGTTVMADLDKWNVILGGLVVLAPIFELITEPGKKAEFFDSYRARFLEIKWKLLSGELCPTRAMVELNKLYAVPCDEIEAIRVIAQNNVNIIMGADPCEKETRWHWFWRWIA